MTGKIYAINHQRGMVAVLTESEGFSIFEMLYDTNFKVGDIVLWTEDHPLGHDDIKNISENETSEVYFQNHCVSSCNLSKQLLL